MTLIFKHGSFFQPHNFVDTSANILISQYYFPVNHQAEYIVHLKDCVGAVGELRRVVTELKLPVNLISEVRISYVA